MWVVPVLYPAQINSRGKNLSFHPQPIDVSALSLLSGLACCWIAALPASFAIRLGWLASYSTVTWPRPVGRSLRRRLDICLSRLPAPAPSVLRIGRAGSRRSVGADRRPGHLSFLPVSITADGGGGDENGASRDCPIRNRGREFRGQIFGGSEGGSLPSIN